MTTQMSLITLDENFRAVLHDKPIRIPAIGNGLYVISHERNLDKFTVNEVKPASKVDSLTGELTYTMEPLDRMTFHAKLLRPYAYMRNPSVRATENGFSVTWGQDFTIFTHKFNVKQMSKCRETFFEQHHCMIA